MIEIPIRRFVVAAYSDAVADARDEAVRFFKRFLHGQRFGESNVWLLLPRSRSGITLMATGSQCHKNIGDTKVMLWRPDLHPEHLWKQILTSIFSNIPADDFHDVLFIAADALRANALVNIFKAQANAPQEPELAPGEGMRVFDDDGQFTFEFIRVRK